MKKKLVGIVLTLAMIVTCLFAFTACDNNNAVEVQKDVEKELFENENLEKITFVLDWSPNTNHTGLYVAKHLGFFAEEGLNVSFIQPDVTGTSAAISVGNGQFGIDFQEQMIWNEKNNVNVTAVASIIQHNTSGIVSQKSKGIATPKDLVGHEYATWSMPGEQAIVKAMIKADGGDPSKLTMIPNTVMDIVSEFKNPNGVDAVWSYKAWDYQFLEAAGIETNFIEMRDIPGLDYYTPVIIANNDFLKEKPEVAKKFLKAVSRGYNFAIENPVSAAYMLMIENPELAESKDIIIRSQKFLADEYKSDAPYWGYIDSARWDGFFNLMVEIGKDFELVDPNLQEGDVPQEIVFPTDITDGYGFTNEYLPQA